jgi:hypothetical protein
MTLNSNLTVMKCLKLSRLPKHPQQEHASAGFQISSRARVLETLKTNFSAKEAIQINKSHTFLRLLSATQVNLFYKPI